MASRRFAPALVLLVLLDVSACGSSSDSTSRTSAREELSSGRVDVGGYQLDWMCRGVGSPTVVAEAGYDSAGTDTWVDLLGRSRRYPGYARMTVPVQGRATLAPTVST
jgi:hypothetical protein